MKFSVIKRNKNKEITGGFKIERTKTNIKEFVYDTFKKEFIDLKGVIKSVEK